MFKICAKLGIHLFGRFFSIQSVCKYLDCEVEQQTDINSDCSIQAIREYKPDLIISISASQIFKKKLIEIPKWGTINVHNSPLPRYQGLMPSFWVLCNNEKSTATTVHFVDENIDSGKIILQKKVNIRKHETLDSLITKTKLLTADILEEVIRLFKRYNGMPPTLKNNPEEATYFSFPQKKDVKRFRQNGGKLLWPKFY